VQESALPANADPLQADLSKPDERARLARLLQRGLETPAGFVLPLKAEPPDAAAGDGVTWLTSPWPLRRERLYLVAGDSPLGLRLPLASLPEVLPDEVEPDLPVDPFAPTRPLPPRESLKRAKGRRRPATPRKVVKTALGIEVRAGHLRVFMPPLARIEDYAALLAAIEDTAAALELRLLVEGYTPPNDPRFNVIKVTPDPGVIEVNVQPASSWDEAVAITTGLYEEAHQTRLSTEKFLIDGRHTGTGGGNHIVLGGSTPADSPFLRRPDLLASLIAYWQNHPSLSYLFSGLFIGPTSQAPRVDEGRHEALYELEIALSQIPEPGAGVVPPWLVDRIFRHLLIDVTGNTHRAEICIDKLYSPDGPTGRLGLVEFRSFEMPPHERMSLAQQLLLRALIVTFWERPYRQKLVRWGTALHDRFMLPHYLWADFALVIDDVKAAGLPIDLDWFRPHYEFRFPCYGKVDTHNVEIELRQALEPWHVLGEEGAVGGTARYVDSSLERLQVKVRGLASDRFAVTCNGRRLPLSSTGTFGEEVAGVRFRAWAPASVLHPTIGPHVPLTFDIADTWTGRSLAGCRYHVSHPGGRNFEVFPVNAYEAEGRRLARFEPFGHSSGRLVPGLVNRNADYPMTLDLRRST
jgi:uncharacterized protein (DUF2126 family)